MPVDRFEFYNEENLLPAIESTWIFVFALEQDLSGFSVFFKACLPYNNP